MTDPRSVDAKHSSGNDGAEAMIAAPKLPPPRSAPSPSIGEMPPAVATGLEMPRGEMNDGTSDAASMTGNDGATGEMPGAATDDGAMNGAILTEMPAGAMTGNEASTTRVGAESAMPRGDMNDESLGPVVDNGGSGAFSEMPGAAPGSAIAGLDGAVTIGGIWKLTFTVGNGV